MEMIHFYAAKGQCQSLLRELKKGVDINLRDTQGYTPLFHAVYDGQLEMVKLLLENGASIYIEDNCNQTPLHAAVVSLYYTKHINETKIDIYFKIINLLLKHEKQLRSNTSGQYKNIPLLKDTKTDRGYTPLKLCESLSLVIAAPHYDDKLRKVIEGYYPEPNLQEDVGRLFALFKDITNLFVSPLSSNNRQEQEETERLLSSSPSVKYKHD